MSPAGRWLPLATPSGSALNRAEPGVRLDHDSGLMHISTRDGRTVVVGGVDEQRFKAVVDIATRTATGAWAPARDSACIRNLSTPRALDPGWRDRLRTTWAAWKADVE